MSKEGGMSRGLPFHQQGKSWVGWAVVKADGGVYVDCAPNATESDAWQVALGWPDPDEIEDAKKNGARAFQCLVTEIAPIT